MPASRAPDPQREMRPGRAAERRRRGLAFKALPPHIRSGAPARRRNQSSGEKTDMRAGSFLVAAALCFVSLPAFGTALKFQADNWEADCELDKTETDCSIIAVLRANTTSTTKGSFALAIELRTGLVALVGKPDPVKALIKVDKYPAFECTGNPCLVPNGQAKTLIDQLSIGRLVLVDVVSQKEVFRLSTSTTGYRSSLAKIQAHRDLLR
jgi:hypothetical protein